MATACWFCPLFPAVEAAETETRHLMQEEDEVPGAIPFPWAVPHAATSGASPSLSSGFQVERQENGRFRTRPHAVRGRVGPHRSAQLSRRRALGRLVKAGAVGALAASVLGSGYLLTTALLKCPSPPGPGTSHPQQALNTAQIFTNPKDGRQGLLVRLPDGTFVAYARACTHSGVYVNYDSKTHLLVCPAHGAIFDPAHGGRVVQGPAPRPLPQVPLRAGSDGTIIIGE